MTVEEFVDKLADNILDPIVLLLFSLALLYFVWGVIKFIANADDPTERGVGKSTMIWGVIGMFIMFGVWGIVALIQGSLGI